MAMVLYNPNKRSRSDSMNTDMVRYMPQRRVTVNRGKGYKSQYAGQKKTYSKGYNRDKFSIMNTRQNPVYPRPEVKYLDIQIGTSAVPVAILNDGTNMTAINTPSSGTASTNRIGAVICSKSVYYQFVLNMGTAAAPIVVRHMLIWDRQSNGALPALSDILQNVTVGQVVLSPMNLFNRERFVVLADDRITMSPNADIITYTKGYRTVNQNSTFSAATTPTTGCLFVLFASDEAAGTSAPTVYGTWRFRFLDC